MARLGKPKNETRPTRFLYVANCTVNGANGVGEDAIRQCFEQFGDVLTIDSKDDRGYLLLSFSSVESAIHAKDHLHGTSPALLANRRLTIRFADELPVPEPSELSQIVCTSCTSQVVVPGLSLLENFLSHEQEQTLLQQIDAQPWLQVIQRRVQHYGFAFNYDSRDVDACAPLGAMPDFCNDVIDQLLKLRPDLERPDQITVNEYLPGQGIASHVDTPSAFGDYICSLSLNSDIVMDFRDTQDPRLVKHVLLSRRSMCVMKNDARYHWKHGIAYRKTDLVQGQTLARARRVSLTLRKVRIKSSDQDQDQDQQVGESFAPSQVEVEHVHKVYDEIAPHFSSTRHHPWPLVTEFLQQLEPGSIVADVGCGNGKYLGVNPSICIIGSDRSIPLLTCAVNKSFEVFGCDALRVPLASGAFDAAISIAVLHHMSTIEHRLQLIRELARIVRIGGRLFIVAWAFEQDVRSKRKFETQDVLVEWKLQDKFAATEKNARTTTETKDSNTVDTVTATSHAQRDAEKRWIVYQRYCHVYQQGELEQLIGQIPGLRVLKTEYSRSNWCIEVERC